MGREARANDWIVDLEAGLASRAAHVVTFNPRGDRTIAIAFVAGGDCSLEEQCLIAGEAVEAIWATIDESRKAG